MNRYIVSYDLLKPGRSYERLYARIEWLGECARVTQSSWVLETRWSLEAVRNYLARALDGNDKLFVGELGAAVFIGLDRNAHVWLESL